ncbi:MAG: hypothetical protein P0Y53_13005 [Candidatus Pseudobacter hemicellulosilyticus]|uniref:ABC-2 type transport system ATP-binding protein n=1 Tax=Candidatus Pseudobacter hemicellulosilyticus TaxID=3121375 RepID=A0AAJ6BIK6_9BACT|nr:MAG: hypothetical protein P0Y53_13005 [Pseudobacter sp.]
MDAFNNYIEPHSVVVRLERMPSLETLESIEGVTRAELLSERQVRLYFNGDEEIAEKIVAASLEQGWRLREISLDKHSVEEIFKQLSRQSS